MAFATTTNVDPIRSDGKFALAKTPRDNVGIRPIITVNIPEVMDTQTISFTFYGSMAISPLKGAIQAVAVIGHSYLVGKDNPVSFALLCAPQVLPALRCSSSWMGAVLPADLSNMLSMLTMPFRNMSIGLSKEIKVPGFSNPGTD